MRGLRLALVLLVVAAAPSCRLENDNELAANRSSSSRSSTTTTLFQETTTTESVASTAGGAASAAARRTTTRPGATQSGSSPGAPRRPAPTAPPTTRGPFCDVFASPSHAVHPSTVTISVRSSFPSQNADIRITGEGYSQNINRTTDSGGSITHSQRTAPTMQGQRMSVNVSVGSRSCSTSFTVS